MQFQFSNRSPGNPTCRGLRVWERARDNNARISAQCAAETKMSIDTAARANCTDFGIVFLPNGTPPGVGVGLLNQPRRFVRPARRAGPLAENDRKNDARISAQ